MSHYLLSWINIYHPERCFTVICVFPQIFAKIQKVEHFRQTNRKPLQTFAKTKKNNARTHLQILAQQCKFSQKKTSQKKINFREKIKLQTKKSRNKKFAKFYTIWQNSICFAMRILAKICKSLQKSVNFHCSNLRAPAPQATSLFKPFFFFFSRIFAYSPQIKPRKYRSSFRCHILK